MNKNIVIKLDPMTDGFTEEKMAEKAFRADRHALVIATNGDLRLTDLIEAESIMRDLEKTGCGGSMILGDEFVLLFNDNKAFDLEEGRFFVGSVLVLKISGKHLHGLSDEEIIHVQDLLDGRMATMVAGDQKFSALALD